VQSYGDYPDGFQDIRELELVRSGDARQYQPAAMRARATAQEKAPSLQMQCACTVSRLRAAGTACVQLPATRQTVLKRKGGRSGVAESGSETTTDSEQMRTRRTACELNDQSLLHVLDPAVLAVWLNVATLPLRAFAIRLVTYQ
jgi:hypothetical protein